jgi:general secretion pathway protein H
MWSSQPLRARSGGFTLIEILVVVVIIAVVTAGVLLSVSATSGHDRELEKESERMLALLNYTREQAEVRTREFGLLCTGNSYQFVNFDPRRGQWATVETDDILRARELPEGLSITLQVEGRPIVLKPPADPKDLTPQLMLYSNGDLTPFELTLLRDDGNRSIAVASTDKGLIEALPMKEGRT